MPRHTELHRTQFNVKSTKEHKIAKKCNLASCFIDNLHVQSSQCIRSAFYFESAYNTILALI